MTLTDLAVALGLGAGRGAKALAKEASRTSPSRRVVALSEPIARALELEGHQPIRATWSNGRLGLEDGAGDALCGSGLPELAGAGVDAALRTLAECTRVVKEGGTVLVATSSGLARSGPERWEVTALLLHAGLCDLAQRTTGGTVITTGRVRR